MHTQTYVYVNVTQGLYHQQKYAKEEVLPSGLSGRVFQYLPGPSNEALALFWAVVG